MKKIFLLTIFIFLVSCTIGQNVKDDEDVIGDGGFISLKPCGPPCFFGITPGVTSYEEAMNLMDTQKNIFGVCKEIDHRQNGGSYEPICDHGIGLSFSENIVDGIGFSLLGNITIQQVIDSYGPPDSIEVYLDYTLPNDPLRSGIYLSFNQFQAYLAMADQNGTEFRISSNSIITEISYFSKERFKQLQILSESTGGLVQWKGYGVYEAELP